MLLAHRAAWLVTHGEIPDGMTLDHLCHTADPTCPGGVADPHRRCCNPAHLEPVSLAENKRRGLSGAARNARKETCKYGHRNWKVRANGSRRCVDCHRRDSINQSRRSRG